MAQPAEAPTAFPAFRQRRPIDLVHLARQTMGDPALEGEVLRLFAGQVRVQFERIRDAAMASDLKGLSMELHTLRGVTASVGARAICHLAQCAERELGEKGRLRAETIEDLGHSVAEATAFIDDMLGI